LLLRRWLLVVGLHGLRRGEADHLRPIDINIEEGYLDIRIHRNEAGKIIWKPKFGIERKVPIVEAAMPLLKVVRDLPVDKHGYVFGVHDRRKAFGRALVASEVEGNVRFHDFRHTAYTKLKEAALEQHDREMALADMRLIFGHADRSMDRIYDHRTVERLRKLMALTPLVEPVKGLLAADRL
jgi:integrase